MQKETERYRVTNLIGTPTDYSNRNNWAHLPESADKEVDTFFVYPTVYVNPKPDAPMIVPVEDEMLRNNVKVHFQEAPQAFLGLTNLYEPYYRQSNLCALREKGKDSSMPFQQQEQRTDVYAALDFYFENYNQGRPFILAGHSQGSLMLKIALRDYFKEHTDYLERMIAAYVIGFSITTEDLEANPALKFAEGADDTGVIVSWNTEGPGNKNAQSPVVMEHSIAINPLNWKRDDTYASESENLGDRLPADDGSSGFFPTSFVTGSPGHADAQVDVERGVVICTKLDGYYCNPSIPGTKSPFGPASLHTVDYGAYWENLRANIRTRINAYFGRTS